MADDEPGRNPPQVKALAARQDRGQDLLRFGGGKHELHMRGRFLECLKQRVERLLRQHVNLVDDVDFEFRRGRSVFDRVAQFADFLDAAVAGAVNFDHIQRSAFGNFPAARIVVVEIRLRPARAVEAFGENARDGGLARAARAAEKVGVRDAVLADGVDERLRDVLLAHDVAEPLRPIFSRDDLIAHLSAERGVRSAKFGGAARSRRPTPRSELRVPKLRMPG